MTCPARAMPRASCAVKASPAADALRAPTIAIFERRRLGAPQKCWIVRLATPDKTRARAVRRLNLPLDFRDGRDADRSACLAARDQSRQSRERRAGAPMAAEKNLKCPGADIFAAQEPQPVKALAVVEGAKRFRG